MVLIIEIGYALKIIPFIGCFWLRNLPLKNHLPVIKYMLILRTSPPYLCNAETTKIAYLHSLTGRKTRKGRRRTTFQTWQELAAAAEWRRGLGAAARNSGSDQREGSRAAPGRPRPKFPRGEGGFCVGELLIPRRVRSLQFQINCRLKCCFVLYVYHNILLLLSLQPLPSEDSFTSSILIVILEWVLFQYLRLPSDTTI